MSVRGGEVQSCFAAEHFSNKETETEEGEGLQPHAVIFISSMSNTTNRERMMAKPRTRVHV